MSLDIFPQPGASHPVLLFIHGGYWRSLDKESFHYPAIGLSEAGVVYISINYALAPMVSLDQIVEQCRHAVTWCTAMPQHLAVIQIVSISAVTPPEGTLRP